MDKVDRLSVSKVLLVDDEEFARASYEKIIKKKVAEVYTAENGLVGLELYKKHRPNIVVTDLEMPVMSGAELIAEIRKLDKETPIIIATAFEDEAQGIDGVNLIMTKPINLKELLENMEKLLSSRK